MNEVEVVDLFVEMNDVSVRKGLFIGEVRLSKGSVVTVKWFDSTQWVVTPADCIQVSKHKSRESRADVK